MENNGEELACLYCSRSCAAGSALCANCSRLCTCGHPKGRHFKGLGTCDVRSPGKYGRHCVCYRFSPDKGKRHLTD